MLTQTSIPPEALLYVFKAHPRGPFRYYDRDELEYSSPGFLAQVTNPQMEESGWENLRADGYTQDLDGTVDIMVLDKTRCNIQLCHDTLFRLALRMN